ncbi:MAG: hypothetical protein PWQ20_890 [Thermotogaceae bacterium]|jgi:radical SAM protein with 4Fe4S-binding SPASM domain|nr:hypothetical protein [Thermotogaceae bacterium]MDN5337820.1 hypothetical protein [Thermotogaceae bacterium]
MRKPPYIVEYELTTECNLRCKHCYCEAGLKNKNEMTLEEIKTLMRDLKDTGVELLDLIGGEPLLHPAFLDIIAFGKEIGQRIMVNTNGILATEDYVRKIKEFNDEILIGVSLDGPDSETNDFIRGKGSFERAVSGIKNFVKYGFEVIILSVINKLNWNKLEEMIKLAEVLGVKGMYLDRFIPVGRGELNSECLNIDSEEWLEISVEIQEVVEKNKNKLDFYIEESISGKVCPAGINQASIRSDGTVVPCGHFRYTEQLHMGNLREKSFKEIWYSFDPSKLDNFLGDYQGGCKALKLQEKVRS